MLPAIKSVGSAQLGEKNSASSASSASASSASNDELEITLDEPLLVPHDHSLLLKAVQGKTAALIAALGNKARLRPLPPEPLLRAIAALPGADGKTRLTAMQVLTFVGPLTHTPLPSSYAAHLTTLDEALAAAENPLGIIRALSSLKENAAPQTLAAFLLGVEEALALIGDALGTAGTMMTGVTVFGRTNPTAVARACARGCVQGALTGAIVRVPAAVSGVVGGVIASTTTLLAVTMDAKAA